MNPTKRNLEIAVLDGGSDRGEAMMSDEQRCATATPWTCVRAFGACSPCVHLVCISRPGRFAVPWQLTDHSGMRLAGVVLVLLAPPTSTRSSFRKSLNRLDWIAPPSYPAKFQVRFRSLRPRLALRRCDAATVQRCDGAMLCRLFR